MTRTSRAASITRAPRWVHALAVLSLAAALVPLSAGHLGAQDLYEVEREVDDLQERLDTATQRFEDVRSRVEATEAELAQLQERAQKLEAQAAEADEALADRARDAFKYGGDTVIATMLSSEGVEGAVERAQFLEVLSGRDRGQLEQALALRSQLDQTEKLIEDRAAELAALEAQLAEQREVLDEQLTSKQALAADLRAIAARQRTINNNVQNGVYACIHDANSFVDSWGAPRSGGRAHKGVDVMAPYGVPVYAFTHGRISRLTSGGLGGISLYLWGDDGNEYFYTHLAGYADGVHVGMRVEAGQKIAINGDTGNARGTPHVHFELHPGGGGAINPYPYMRAAC